MKNDQSFDFSVNYLVGITMLREIKIRFLDKGIASGDVMGNGGNGMWRRLGMVLGIGIVLEILVHPAGPSVHPIFAGDVFVLRTYFLWLLGTRGLCGWRDLGARFLWEGISRVFFLI